MIPAVRPNPGDFPDSPYAAELQRVDAPGRFRSELEAEYLRMSLIDSRMLVRGMTACSVVLTLGHAAGQMASGMLGAGQLAQLAVFLAGSALLAGLAWSRAFELWYRPVANVVLPLRNAIGGIYFTACIAHGQLALLMLMPLLVVAPFFLLGLRFRPALGSGIVTVATFIVCAALFGVHLPLLARTGTFLLATLIFSATAAHQVEVWSRRRFLESHLVAELAQRDALTGTKNRRVFNDHLARIWQQAVRDHACIGVLLIDVDHFKAYNDRYGHLAGDEALRRVARTLQGFVHRPLDIFARYGGEEFAVILYGLAARDARDIAERMRRAVVELEIEHRASPTCERLTISIGVAAIDPVAGRNCRGALQLADQALYGAKVKGRNLIELLDDVDYESLATGVFASALWSGAQPSASEKRA